MNRQTDRQTTDRHKAYKMQSMNQQTDRRQTEGIENTVDELTD